MAFAVPQRRVPTASSVARSDSRPSSSKSTTKQAVRLDNTPGSKTSSTKPVQPASLASSPMGPKTTSPSTSTSLRAKRNSVTSFKEGSDKDENPGRVRVAVRLRPRNADEKILDKDCAECLELQAEMKRVQLRKNNWEYDNYRFDEVMTETSSQKRVYEVVAKPVVESVCEGYNGTVMAYGQSGTGKTFTLGHLGEKDTADRGIMVRAFEDILSNVTSADDSITVSYLQLYKETVQDLLAPEKDNIAIVEDPRTGDVTVPGARQVELKDQQSFLQLLQTGETNRFAANTKLNTQSSRSHAILLVNLKMVMKTDIGDRHSANLDQNGGSPQFAMGKPAANTVRKSKLLIVDLAGSERIDKSGSEGRVLEEAKHINLSLTALGKCVNALADNSPHVPIRDSKLTRMLRDSFGGTARTSLIVTIGPSPRNRGETASTIAFGQRAMKVENLLKLKEEFDYRSRCRQLEIQVDKLMAENERLCKAGQDAKEDFERSLEEAQRTVDSTEDKLTTAVKEEERLTKEYADILEKLKKSEKEHKDVVERYQIEITDRKRHEEKQEREFAEANLKLEKERKDVVEARENFERKLEDAQIAADKVATAEKNEEKLKKEHADILEKLKKSEKEHKDIAERHLYEITDRKKDDKVLQQELSEANLRLTGERARSKKSEKEINENSQTLPQEIPEFQELKTKLEKETQLRVKLEEEVMSLNLGPGELPNAMVIDNSEKTLSLKQKLDEECEEKETLEEEVTSLKEQVMVLSDGRDVYRKLVYKIESENSSEGSHSRSLHKPADRHIKDEGNEKRATTAKLIEQVGFLKTMSLLESGDVDVCVYKVKMVAQLAAEEANREQIAEAGGLRFLLRILQSYEDETVRCVAAQAIANLSMNERIQELIMAQGGIELLAQTADDAKDPQTLRMVGVAIANLCGNTKLHVKLREEGAIRTLIKMVRSSNADVLGQVARGICNFAKCESRGATQDSRNRRSLLINDGALPWIVASARNDDSPTRRHIEIALFHLAQNEANSNDLIASGALSEMVRLSQECSQESIRNFLRETVKTNVSFQTELNRRHSD